MAWHVCVDYIDFLFWQLVVELYEILVNVDKSCDHLRYLDPITDFLYPFTTTCIRTRQTKTTYEFNLIHLLEKLILF